MRWFVYITQLREYARLEAMSKVLLLRFTVGRDGVRNRTRAGLVEIL